MDQEQARSQIGNYVREHFGKIVELREVSVVRHASGRAWVGDLYCVTKRGDVRVGRIGVAENGHIIGGFGADQLIEALSRMGGLENSGQPAPFFPPGQEDRDEDFFDFGLEDSKEKFEKNNEVDEIEGFFAGLDSSDIRARVDELMASELRENLLEARKLLPQLLTNPKDRGKVLKQMGELEIRLGETDLGLNYLEASAREFTDQAEMDALEDVADRTLRAIGQEAYSKHVVKELLDYARARQKPADNLAEVSVFTGLGSEEMFELTETARLLTARAGQNLLQEGELAERAFAVKSGILSIRLETPGGGSRVVRCCFPKDFVGESCVVGLPGTTCSATVRSECISTLWAFDGARLREIALQYPSLKARIESAQTLNRLDSFFSMNEATENLDVRVRDQLLSCITGIRSARPDEVLCAAGSVPDKVYLVTQGLVEYRRPGVESRAFSSDSFVGLRDALHGLALEGDCVVVQQSRLICFDPDALRELAGGAPPQVAAVLERL